MRESEIERDRDRERESYKVEIGQKMGDIRKKQKTKQEDEKNNDEILIALFV